MKRIVTAMTLAGLAAAVFSTESLAGPNENAKIQLHLLATTTKQQCTRIQTTPACASVVTTGNLYPQMYFAHVLVTDGNVAAGIAGVQFGIAYTGPGSNDQTGIDIFSWSLCATLEFQSPSPQWTNSGSGNLITWDANTRCQRFVPAGNDPANGVCANAGYFYMAAYNPGTMSITPRPTDGLAKVADCSAAEDIVEGGSVIRNPSHLGRLGFGGQQGYNPCGLVVPTRNTTWSALKAVYNN